MIIDSVHLHAVFFCGDLLNIKGKYLTSACILLFSSIIVKFISAVYKIPLSAYIGAVGRGYYTFAYNLIMPVHAVTMGAFPVALSKLVSKYNSLGNIKMVHSLKKCSIRLFGFVGLFSMIFLLLFAKPYSDFIVKSPDTVYTAVVLAPSVLFSCMAASYRGYFEGNINMLPTAVSQIIEALFKMVFGILFAKFSVSALLNQYNQTSTVLGIAASDYDSAFALIYPFSSAASMLGVTLGSLVSLCYLWAYSVFKTNKSEKVDNYNASYVRRLLILQSYPIMISTCVQSIFQFLDTASIQYALNNTSYYEIKRFFSHSLSYVSVLEKDLPTFACGIHSAALDFKNIVPGITMALGVSAVPVISSLYETKNTQKLKVISDSIYKYTFMLSSVGGLILYFCCDNMLNILYRTSSPDIAQGALDITKYYALTVPCFSLAGISVFSVQALGKAEKSIPSYIVCGIIRVVLNVFLIQNTSLLLYGVVISSAIGYTVMLLWNVIIYKKYAKIKLSFLKTFALPILAEIVSFVITNVLLDNINYYNNEFVLIILKTFIVTLTYCFLCFLCGLLNFKRFFRYLTHKNIPQTLANKGKM